MNIYEIVNGNGFVIFADEETSTLITWNGSATFLWWVRDLSVGNWNNTDIKTYYYVKTIAEAEAEAKKWFDYEMETAGLTS